MQPGAGIAAVIADIEPNDGKIDEIALHEGGAEAMEEEDKQVFEPDEVVKLEEENTLDCKALKTTLFGPSGHCSPEAGEFVLETELHGAGANAPGVGETEGADCGAEKQLLQARNA